MPDRGLKLAFRLEESLNRSRGRAGKKKRGIKSRAWKSGFFEPAAYFTSAG
jgi:hypothetical protein